MLGPGGHIQWQDLDWQDIRSYPTNPDLDKINHLLTRHMKAHGLSERYEIIFPEFITCQRTEDASFSVLIESSMREVGLVDVNAEKSWHDASPARAAGSTAAVFAALTSMLPKAIETSLRLEGTGINDKVIEEASEQMKRKLEGLSGNGYNWTLSATLVVGKKL
jgi:hypothetical protein